MLLSCFVNSVRRKKKKQNNNCRATSVWGEVCFQELTEDGHSARVQEEPGSLARPRGVEFRSSRDSPTCSGTSRLLSQITAVYWVVFQNWRTFWTLLHLSLVRQDESAQVALSCELVGCFVSGEEQAGAGSR